MTRPVPDAAQLLARSAFLGALGAEACAALAAAGHVRQIDPDVELFRAGDPCEEVQVLLVGRVRLWRLTADSHVLVLHTCGTGEVLGQMSALDGEAHSVHATAVTHCRVLAVPARAFRELLQARPGLALALARVLARRVRALSEELEAMKFSSISERVRVQLHREGERLRELRLTHQELADRVGATRENVSRVLGLLRDRGILRLGRGRIEILDHDRLDREEL